MMCDVVYVGPCLFPEINQVLDGSGIAYPPHSQDNSKRSEGWLGFRYANVEQVWGGCIVKQW